MLSTQCLCLLVVFCSVTCRDLSNPPHPVCTKPQVFCPSQPGFCSVIIMESDPAQPERMEQGSEPVEDSNRNPDQDKTEGQSPPETDSQSHNNAKEEAMDVDPDQGPSDTAQGTEEADVTTPTSASKPAAAINDLKEDVSPTKSSQGKGGSGADPEQKVSDEKQGPGEVGAGQAGSFGAQEVSAEDRGSGEAGTGQAGDAATDHTDPTQATTEHRGEEEGSADADNTQDTKKKSSGKSAVPALSKADSEAMRVLDSAPSKSRKRKSSKSSTTSSSHTEEEVTYEFPKTLSEFGFKFNEQGELRSIEHDKPFEFQVKDDYEYNQQRYEALGEIITDHVYKLLEERTKLERIDIPFEAETKTSFFYASPGCKEKEKLVVIIHGSGVVRAGQWTRKLIINEDLAKGTQLPYIEWGLERDYGIVVLNTNHQPPDDGSQHHHRRTQGYSLHSPEGHGLYVWEKFISETKAEKIAVVAHSYGGIVTVEMAKDERTKTDFCKRVFAVAFTDSVHSMDMQDVPKSIRKFFANMAVNWISSNEPIDTAIRSYDARPDAKRVSAGHEKHEWTSYAAMESVFTFIEQRYNSNGQAEEDKGSCTSL